jgi:hypothetical protein
MQPSLQAPDSVVFVRMAGTPCHVGLRYIKAPLANFAIRAG